MGAPAQTKAPLAALAGADLPAALRGRLGLDVPREHWPAVPRLKALEAAGFAWLQVHCPPKAMLADSGAAAYHGECLRALLEPTALRLVLHAPDGLITGAERDVVAGLAAHANCSGAEIVVVHGAVGPTEHRELAALRALAAAISPAVVAVENTASTYPGPARPGHDLPTIVALVEQADRPNIRTCLDLGHAHLRATSTGADLGTLIAPALERAAVVHVHDNHGAHRQREGSPRHVPLRLDLHLPPGAGALPWPAVSPALLASRAALLLELHPPHRPEPQSLATVTAELLARAS